MNYEEFIQVGCMGCGGAGNKYCDCGAVYCSQECQADDWKRVHHKDHKSRHLLETRRRELYADISRTPEVAPTRIFPSLPQRRPEKVQPRPAKRTVWNDPNVPKFLQDSLPVYDSLHRKSMQEKTAVMQEQANVVQGLVREVLSDQQNRALDRENLRLMSASRRYARLLQSPAPSTEAMSEAMQSITASMSAIQEIVAAGRTVGDAGQELMDAAVAMFNAAAETADCSEAPWEGSSRQKKPTAASATPSVGDHLSGTPPPKASQFGPKYTSSDGTLVQSTGKNGRVEFLRHSVSDVQAAQDRDYTAQVLESGKWLDHMIAAQTLAESTAAYRGFEREFRERGEQQRTSAARGIRNTSYRQQQVTISQAEIDALNTEELFDWLMFILRRTQQLSKNKRRRPRRQPRVGVNGDSGEEEEEDYDSEEEVPEREQLEKDTGFLDTVGYIWRNIKRTSGKAAYVGMMALVITGRTMMPDLQGTASDVANSVNNSFPLAEGIVDGIGEAVEIVSVSAELGGHSALQIILEDQGDLFHAYELDRIDIDDVLESEYQMALDFPNSAALLSEFDVLYAETAISFEKYFLTLRDNVHDQTGLVGDELQVRTNQLMSMFTGDVAVLNDENSSSDEQAHALERINENVRALEQTGFESMWANSLARYTDTEDLEFPQDPQAFLDKTLDALFNKAQFTNETAQRVLMSVDQDEYLKLIPFPWTELPRVLAPTQVARDLRPVTTALYLQTVAMYPDNQLKGDLVFSLLDTGAGVSRYEATLRRSNQALANVTLDEDIFEEYSQSWASFSWAWVSWAVWFHAYSYLIDFVLPEYVPEEELEDYRTKQKMLQYAREEAVQLWAEQYTGGALAASTVGKIYTNLPYVRSRLAYFLNRAKLSGGLRMWENMQRTSMKAISVMMMTDLAFWAASEANFLLSHTIPQYFLTAVAHDKAMRGMAGDVTMDDAFNQAQALTSAMGAPDAVSWGVVTVHAAQWVLGVGLALYSGPAVLQRLARSVATVFHRSESKNWRKVVVVAKLAAILTVYRMDMSGIGNVNTGWVDHNHIDVGPQPYGFNFNAVSLRQQAANEQYFAQFIPKDFGEDPMRMAAGRTVVERRFDTSFWDDIVMQAALNPANLDSPTLEKLQATYYTLQEEAKERLKEKKKSKEPQPTRPRPKPREKRERVPRPRKAPVPGRGSLPAPDTPEQKQLPN